MSLNYPLFIPFNNNFISYNYPDFLFYFGTTHCSPHLLLHFCIFSHLVLILFFYSSHSQFVKVFFFCFISKSLLSCILFWLPFKSMIIFQLYSHLICIVWVLVRMGYLLVLIKGALKKHLFNSMASSN